MTLDAATREHLLDELAILCARGGWERFLTAPVAPRVEDFPDPWRPTRVGVRTLIRRLAWHAGLDIEDPTLAPERRTAARAIRVDDRRHGAPPTQRRPETNLELLHLDPADATFALFFIGEDDVCGTFAHELGVWFGALHRPDASQTPYRSATADRVEVDAEHDLERGSRATVYLGLGVVAANAAYQEYSRAGRFNGAYSPLEHDIVKGGYVAMSELAFLLAIQAIVRDSTTAPAGLGGPQRDEVTAFVAELRGQRDTLRDRLGIPRDANVAARPVAVAFEVDLFADEDHRKDAFRWRANRGGVGILAGGVLGAGVALLVASRGLAPIVVAGCAGAGHAVGRRVRVPRCTACAAVIAETATVCSACGAHLHGDIASPADRLDAEERLGK